MACICWSRLTSTSRMFSGSTLIDGHFAWYPAKMRGSPVPLHNLPIITVIAAESSLRERHRCHSRLLRRHIRTDCAGLGQVAVLLRTAASIIAVRVANGSLKGCTKLGGLALCMHIIFAVFRGQFLDSFNYTSLPSSASGERLFTNQLSHAPGEILFESLQIRAAPYLVRVLSGQSAWSPD
jgi:hypothetical protein